MADLLAQLPASNKVQDAICRVKITYPDNLEPLLDENQIIDHFSAAFSVQIQKHRLSEKRSRLGDTLAVETLTREALLEKYWQTQKFDAAEIAELQAIAFEVFATLDE